MSVGFSPNVAGIAADLAIVGEVARALTQRNYLGSIFGPHFAAAVDQPLLSFAVAARLVRSRFVRLAAAVSGHQGSFVPSPYVARKVSTNALTFGARKRRCG